MYKLRFFLSFFCEILCDYLIFYSPLFVDISFAKLYIVDGIQL